MAEGQMSIGNFELRNCIASGSSTQIWEVSEYGSPMQLVMKLLIEAAHKDLAEKTVLRHEFRVGKSLEHPGFLRFHQIEVNRDHGFFIMDFVRSPNLKTQIIADRAATQASFRKLAETLTLAFQFMHENGWLHRDIKPENILVNRAGEARVIDFSLSSRVQGRWAKTLSGKPKIIKGTRTYIAPETILKKPADQRTDMYSLGVTFYEVLTGHSPFAGASPEDLLKKHLAEDPLPLSVSNPNVTPELDKVILKMLAKNPANRFESMQEVASALRGLRCFKEDPVEVAERKNREQAEKETQSIDKRLDSRADHERTKLGIEAPLRTKKEKPSAVVMKEEQKRREREVAQQTMPQHTVAPGMAPMMPGMSYPFMPGYGVPQMPGMQMPGMQMPGMQMPGMQMPGMQMPGMQMPGMQMPGMPVPMQPYQAAPVTGQPAGVPHPPAQGQASVTPSGATPAADSDSSSSTAAPSPPATPRAADPQDATEHDVQNLMDLVE